MSQDLLFSAQDGIARITINRPDAMGAMTIAMWAELLKLIQEIEHDPDIRCVVIASEGKNFCAGADVKEFARYADLSARELAVHWMRQADIINPLFVTLERLPQPVVASVRGIAAGGGLGIVAACDLIVASETVSFFAAQIKLGAISDSAVSFNLRRAIGIKKAKQYCFLGDTMNAAEAEKLGLVNWVVADGQLETETDKLATRLAHMPVVALARTKATLNHSFQNSLVEHFAEEALDVGRCVMHPDFVNNVKAFAQKRK